MRLILPSASLTMDIVVPSAFIFIFSRVVLSPNSTVSLSTLSGSFCAISTVRTTDCSDSSIRALLSLSSLSAFCSFSTSVLLSAAACNVAASSAIMRSFSEFIQPCISSRDMSLSSAAFSSSVKSPHFSAFDFSLSRIPVFTSSLSSPKILSIRSAIVSSATYATMFSSILSSSFETLGAPNQSCVRSSSRASLCIFALSLVSFIVRAFDCKFSSILCSGVKSG